MQSVDMSKLFYYCVLFLIQLPLACINTDHLYFLLTQSCFFFFLFHLFAVLPITPSLPQGPPALVIAAINAGSPKSVGLGLTALLKAVANLAGCLPTLQAILLTVALRLENSFARNMAKISVKFLYIWALLFDFKNYCRREKSPENNLFIYSA